MSDHIGREPLSNRQNELVVRRLPTDGRLQWLAGFRWVQWNERIGIESVYAATDNPIQGYSTATNNDLA